MAHRAHNVYLQALLVGGIAQCLAVDGQAAVARCPQGIPGAQRPVECRGIDPHEHIAEETCVPLTQPLRDVGYGEKLFLSNCFSSFFDSFNLGLP